MNLEEICHHQNLVHCLHIGLEGDHHLELVIEVEQEVDQGHGGQGVGQEGEGEADLEDGLDQETDQGNLSQGIELKVEVDQEIESEVDLEIGVGPGQEIREIKVNHYLEEEVALGDCPIVLDHYIQGSMCLGHIQDHGHHHFLVLLYQDHYLLVHGERVGHCLALCQERGHQIQAIVLLEEGLGRLHLRI